MEGKKHVKFGGRLVFVGFGSVGQGSLPLLLRHIDMPHERISHRHGRRARARRSRALRHKVPGHARSRARTIAPSSSPSIGRGDFLLNLSVDVSSVALIELCYEKGAMYLDTCIEPWLGGYTDQSVSPSHRSNYGLREAVLALRAKYPKGPTVIPTHGANPGLISHWVKQAMRQYRARHRRRACDVPKSREEWAQLAMRLGVKVIHCAERDTQVADPRKRRFEFVNTWSVDGFIGEGSQPCELGWGSHEKHFPPDGKQHEFGCKAAIYLTRPGASVKVRSWTPTRRPVSRAPHHARRSDLDLRLLHGAREAAASSTGRPAITRITRATTRCSRCTSSRARAGSDRSSAASSWTRSTTASTSSARC